MRSASITFAGGEAVQSVSRTATPAWMHIVVIVAFSLINVMDAPIPCAQSVMTLHHVTLATKGFVSTSATALSNVPAVINVCATDAIGGNKVMSLPIALSAGRWFVVIAGKFSTVGRARATCVKNVQSSNNAILVL